MPRAHHRLPRHLPTRLGNIVATLCLSLVASFAHAGEFSSFIDLKFTDIPTGSFQMGSCQAATRPGGGGKKLSQTPPAGCSAVDLDALINEGPQHRVSIPGFQMSKTEVTLGQFKRFIIATGRTELVTDEFMKYNAHGDTAPVVDVSWNEAKNFIEWLNKSKAATDHGVYRLPTEAEWEYACHAGGNHPYCGSRDVNAVAWFNANSGKHQQPVGSKNANAFGLHDMSGNVWEWMEDCYHDNYSGAPADGSAWTSLCASSGRVLRGGSWRGDAKNVRVQNRTNATAVNRSNIIGFRLARTPQ
ncbi:MAG: formylglycine-generating enzyme family protein [Gammaproteobacteria bacterium]